MSKQQILRFDALAPTQSPKLTVFSFIAKASEVARIARIGRAGRDDVQGTGIIALGYAMDLLNSVTGAATREEFADGLRLLKGKTAWCEGEWDFGSERRRWNGVQNVPADIRQLSLHLVQVLKRRLADKARAA